MPRIDPHRLTCREVYHTQLKILAAKERRTIRSILEEALDDYFRRHAPQAGRTDRKTA